MAEKKYNKINIMIKNIAPISTLSKSIKTRAIKIGILGNNGSGKTFISRLFRLLEENNENTREDEDVASKLLRLTENKGVFKFSVTKHDDEKNLVEKVEDIVVELDRNGRLRFNKPHYIYHTFNSDYIEENIRKTSYTINDKKMDGFILGESNIALDTIRGELDKCNNKLDEIEKTIQETVDRFVKKKTSHIPYIGAIKEYNLLSVDNLFKPDREHIDRTKKSVDEYLKDFEKVKNIPEDLKDIPKAKEDNSILNYSKDLLNSVIESCKNEYNLNHFGKRFKEKIKFKQEFVELGINLLKEENQTCPFCEQKFDDDAIQLIEMYNDYLNDEEAKTIKELNSYTTKIKSIIDSIQDLENQNTRSSYEFNLYKTNYIPSEEDIELSNLPTSALKDDLGKIAIYIMKKIENIKYPIDIPFNLEESILSNLEKLGEISKENNKRIENLNKKKDSLKEEIRLIKREICKSTYFQLLEMNNENFKKYFSLVEKKRTISTDIDEKENKQKRKKSDAVAKTINIILKDFFNDKYSFDEKHHRLVFNINSDSSNRMDNVLSEGEKSIVAFAYYLGETHLKIEKEADYERLFFIIDDPISSMDYSHVYTLCGCLRELKTFFPIQENERFILLTHNNDFMRIQCSNNIVNKKMRLLGCKLLELGENYSVPYVSHLLDIYKVANKNVVSSHTTANSIRHILETLVKFENINLSESGLNKYIKDNFSSDKTVYILVQDLSHGTWRTEQNPIDEDVFIRVCSSIIRHISERYPEQIAFCERVS